MPTSSPTHGSTTAFVGLGIRGAPTAAHHKDLGIVTAAARERLLTGADAATAINLLD